MGGDASDGAESGVELQKKKIRDLEKRVLESALHLNDVGPLLKFLKAVQRGTDDEVLFEAMHASDRVLRSLQSRNAFRVSLLPENVAKAVMDRGMQHSNKRRKLEEEGGAEVEEAEAEGEGGSAPAKEVVQWMRRKFELFIESLCRVIRDEAEPSLQILALSIIRNHAVAQHKALEWARASSSYPDALLKRTFIAVLETKNWNEHLQRELEEWCTFDDVRIVLFEVVRDFFATKQSQGAVQVALDVLLQSDVPSEISSFCFAAPPPNIKKLIKRWNKRGLLGKRKRDETELSSSERLLVKMFWRESHAKIYSEAWMAVLRQELSASQNKRVLLAMANKVLPSVQKPLLLMDYLVDCYDLGGVSGMLALNGLFVLMTKHNLDYPKFYNKLYQLFNPSIFWIKYRTQFFRLSALFLKSTHLPEYLCVLPLHLHINCACVRNTILIRHQLAFIFNLLVRHSNCLRLIHNTAVSNPDTSDVLLIQRGKGDDGDPYDVNEADPAKCGAVRSSLWELTALREHYDAGVSTFAKAYEAKLRRQPYDLERFFEGSYETSFERRLAFNPKEGPALAFGDVRSLFSHLDDGALEGWEL